MKHEINNTNLFGYRLLCVISSGAILLGCSSSRTTSTLSSETVSTASATDSVADSASITELTASMVQQTFTESTTDHDTIGITRDDNGRVVLITSARHHSRTGNAEQTAQATQTSQHEISHVSTTAAKADNSVSQKAQETKTTTHTGIHLTMIIILAVLVTIAIIKMKHYANNKSV
jgi:hypothetical protein